MKTPAAFRAVTRGLLALPVIGDRQGQWREGETVVGWVFLFGFLPFSRHHLHIARIDDSTRTLSSREFGGGPLSDSFAPVELAGADQAVLAVGMADAFGFPTVLLTVAGGEILEVGIEQTGPDAEAFVTDVSSRWLERQSG